MVGCHGHHSREGCVSIGIGAMSIYVGLSTRDCRCLQGDAAMGLPGLSVSSVVGMVLEACEVGVVAVIG